MNRFSNTLTVLITLFLANLTLAAPTVTAIRVPDGGIQPQVGVDAKHVAHLIYLKGDPKACNIFYVRTSDGGKTFTAPIRVNSQPNAAMAIGTIRGPHIALGADGRVHVAWMGSKDAEPKAPGDKAPMLYTRLNDTGDAFDPQVNLVQKHAGLDGGGTVAADDKGNVYVAWHANNVAKDETDRTVWLRTSTDHGKTFGDEVMALHVPTGVCGCCGLSMFVGRDGQLSILFRSATELVDRDMYLIASADPSRTFKVSKFDPMKSKVCIMSTSAMTQGPNSVLAAWESNQQIYFGAIDPNTLLMTHRTPAPGDTQNRKHPAIAANSNGQILLAWTEGTGWNRGGSVHWVVMDSAGKPLEGTAGNGADLPAWGLPAAFATQEGNFVVVY